MCCPYFAPVRRTGAPGEPGDGAMLPLGDRWAGECRSPSGCHEQPDEPPDRLCNLGYARQECPRFPAGDGPDAVRFAVSSDDGASIRLRFAVERDHHPFAHGVLDYSRSADRFAAEPPGELLARQARAYLERYMFRKGEGK
jgi:hypothetical protein